MGVYGSRMMAEAHDTGAAQAETKDGRAGGFQVIDMGVNFAVR